MNFLRNLLSYIYFPTDFNIDCKPEGVRVRWPLKLTQEQVQNPYTVLLGNCVPSSVSVDGVFFNVGYNDCLFEKAVSLPTFAICYLLTAVSCQFIPDLLFLFVCFSGVWRQDCFHECALLPTKCCGSLCLLHCGLCF